MTTKHPTMAEHLNVFTELLALSIVLTFLLAFYSTTKKYESLEKAGAVNIEIDFRSGEMCGLNINLERIVCKNIYKVKLEDF